MQVTAANNSTAVDYAAAVNVRVPTKSLGQDDFLKLMIVQLQQQDPMNPQKDTEFIAQMAQFSALEQSKEIAVNIAAMRADQQLLQANGLIGRIVGIQGAGGVLTTGTVSGVQVEDGVPQIVVNGQVHTLSSVLAIVPAPANTQPEGVQP